MNSTISLSKVLSRSENWVVLDPAQQYKEITVRLWGKGLVLRRQVLGAEILSSRRNQVNAGQFILSKIDARHGAFGIIPENLQGAVVSPDFPVYSINTTLIDPRYLEWLSRTKEFVNICVQASEGSTNRVRLDETKFLMSKIQLPSLSEQQRIVGYLSEVSGRVYDVNVSRKHVVASMQKMTEIEFKKNLKDKNVLVRQVPFTELVRLERRPIAVIPEGSYSEIGIYSYGRGIFHKPPRSGFEVGNKDLFLVKEKDLILQITFAWEGAIALAGPREDGMFCSVRYPTFRVDETVCNPAYLLMYLKTEEGVSKLGQLSPGSAGRNRVLSIKRLNELIVPVLPLGIQNFLVEELEQRAARVLKLEEEISAISQKIIPSVLNRVF